MSPFSFQASPFSTDKKKIQKKIQKKSHKENSEEEDGAEPFEILPYFHGAIDRAQAESRLKDEHIGTFLIRFEDIFGSNRSPRRGNVGSLSICLCVCLCVYFMQ